MKAQASAAGEGRGVPLSLLMSGAHRHDVSQLQAVLDAIVGQVCATFAAAKQTLVRLTQAIAGRLG